MAAERRDLSGMNMTAYGITRTWTLQLCLCVTLLAFMAAVQDSGAATVTGRMLMQDGTPLSGGFALAFDLQNTLPPDPARYLQPPASIADIGEDGSFTLDLSPGRYAIAAVKRRDGHSGPPREGDIFFALEDANGLAREVDVPEHGRVKLGNLAGARIFRPVSDPLHPTTSVSGTVRDKQGNPAAGMAVGAVLTRQEREDAIFFSHESDSMGSYTLLLPHGGGYRLGVWQNNSLEDAARRFTLPLEIETGGTLTDIDLHMP
ncbi:MAG: hypothetical protein M8357_13575 [Desulfobulbaceae bacterium]|nr:hypothetical protein [Desulfobulbaceae bacterium]